MLYDNYSETLYYLNTTSYEIEKTTKIPSDLDDIITFCFYKHIMFIITCGNKIHSYNLLTEVLKKLDVYYLMKKSIFPYIL